MVTIVIALAMLASSVLMFRNYKIGKKESDRKMALGFLCFFISLMVGGVLGALALPRVLVLSVKAPLILLAIYFLFIGYKGIEKDK